MGIAGNDLHSRQDGVPCPHCGATAEPNAKFCGRCGKVVDPYIGEVLNKRFTIESKLGEGGFGAVYRGKQKGTGRKVALKLLHPDMTQDENLVERFRREGLVLCNLRDAHTVTTYDFDQTDDGTLYIAMELLEGRSLHEVFHHEHRIDWRRMLKILAEMCSSLAEAHSHGIVHRDLKPENIYLEDRPGNPEFVKILDFGIAKVVHGDVVDGSAAQLTAAGQTLGTLEYMSPEQLMGRELDGRSDIYALGVLAYEMITGRLPFPDAKGPAGLITAQLRQVPEPPSTVVDPSLAIAPGVDQIILKALEKDKSNRWNDVDELRHACLELIGSGQWGLDISGEISGRSLTPSPADVVGSPAGQANPGQVNSGPAHPSPASDEATTQPRPRQALPPSQDAGHSFSSMPGMDEITMPPAGSPPAPGVPMGVQPMNGSAPAMGAMPPGHHSGPAGQNPVVQAMPAVQGARAVQPASRVWLWVIIGLAVLGGAIGAALALA